MNDYNDITPSRVKRNANLYKRIDASNLDAIEPTSKEEIIESNTTTIDVEKLKSMLDKKYREPDRPSEIVSKEPINKEINLEETREYNLDEILNKAKNNSESDYGVERLKKLSDTNISILDDLNIKEPTNKIETKENDITLNKSKVSSDSKKLIELIDTINLKEQEGYDSILKESNTMNEAYLDNDSEDIDFPDEEKEDPLEMLSSLTGSDDATKVMGAKKLENNLSVNETEEEKKLEDSVTQLDNKEIKKDKYADIDLNATEEFDTTEVVSRDDTDDFTDSIELTTTQIFTKDDFEDFDDLKEATKPRIFLKILIFLIVIAVIIGTIIVLDRVLDLGILNRLGINFSIRL